jgi:hypothetical protein
MADPDLSAQRPAVLPHHPAVLEHGGRVSLGPLEPGVVPLENMIRVVTCGFS